MGHGDRMLRAEFSSAFLGDLDKARGRAGPFDRALVGRGLGQIFADALSQPVPEEWCRLLQQLDEHGCEAEQEEA